MKRIIVIVIKRTDKYGRSYYRLRDVASWELFWESFVTEAEARMYALLNGIDVVDIADNYMHIPT